MSMDERHSVQSTSEQRLSKMKQVQPSASANRSNVAISPPTSRVGVSTNISGERPNTCSVEGLAVAVGDSETSSSDDLDELEELGLAETYPTSSRTSSKCTSSGTNLERQNSRLSIDSISVSGNDGLDLICVRRLARSATFRRKKSVEKEKQAKNSGESSRGKKRRKFWSFRFKKRLHGRLQRPREGGVADCQQKDHACVCTEIRRTDDHLLGAGIVFSAAASVPRGINGSSGGSIVGPSDPVSSLSHAQLLQSVPAPPDGATTFGPFEDVDEILTTRREQEMRDGIDLGENDIRLFCPVTPEGESFNSQSMGASGITSNNCVTAEDLSNAFQNLGVLSSGHQQEQAESSQTGANSGHYSPYRCLMPQNSYPYPQRVHTQVDYIHCLVPDLLQITNCRFYWGVMDRYEAERLLESRPEGTFLLRDSAQDEFLFSVSFRRYGRSLHARIEQWNHKFSFDSHDPGVFASGGVCGLIEHYKDPSCCMFFEPMLILPLNRSFPFTLQHMCRSVICDRLTYDSINLLPLPNSLKHYLKYYHYKQKVRVRRFDLVECMPY